MRFVAILVVALGVGAVGVGLDRVDHTRTARAVDNALLFAPNGRELKLAATGLEEPIADVLWVRATLIFGERWETDPGDEWVQWFITMLDAINVLDREWRTPYFYGGILLRVLGELDASDAVFLRGAEARPQDWFFPFNVGMNAFIHRDEPEIAAEWLGKAAVLPDAPPWIASTAAELIQRSGDRHEAIRYLQNLARTTPSDEVRADAERQLGRLFHNAFVESWAPLCRQFREANGRPLASAAEFEAVLGHALPPNPRGDDWIVGTDGVVRSRVADKERIRRLRMAEWRIAR